jgi:hypothetical protein
LKEEGMGSNNNNRDSLKAKIVFSIIFFLLIGAVAWSLYLAGPTQFSPKKQFGEKRSPIHKMESHQ